MNREILTIIIFYYCDLCVVSATVNLQPDRILRKDHIKSFIVFNNAVLIDSDVCALIRASHSTRWKSEANIGPFNIVWVLCEGDKYQADSEIVSWSHDSHKTTDYHKIASCRYQGGQKVPSD